MKNYESLMHSDVFSVLNTINFRPELYSCYTAETLWNDEHISKQMLDFHLNEEIDVASRNIKLIDEACKWISSHFNMTSGIRVADFGCGPGLYTSRFAKEGAIVTGIDFSERSITYAKDVAEKNNLDIQYIYQNYLDFETEKKFNLITMIYFDLCALNDKQRLLLLKKFYRFLENGGEVFLDLYSINSYTKRKETIKYEHQLMDDFWSVSDYYGFMNTFKYDKEKVVLDKYTIVEGTKIWEVYNWLKYYSIDILTKEFEEAGFEIIELYSDVMGSPYFETSDEIAVVARKPFN